MDQQNKNKTPATGTKPAKPADDSKPTGQAGTGQTGEKPAVPRE